MSEQDEAMISIRSADLAGIADRLTLCRKILVEGNRVVAVYEVLGRTLKSLSELLVKEHAGRARASLARGFTMDDDVPPEFKE